MIEEYKKEFEERDRQGKYTLTEITEIVEKMCEDCKIIQNKSQSKINQLLDDCDLLQHKLDNLKQENEKLKEAFKDSFLESEINTNNKLQRKLDKLKYISENYSNAILGKYGKEFKEVVLSIIKEN
jgi:FtsZ-binding cell division protein ZapB